MDRNRLAMLVGSALRERADGFGLELDGIEVRPLLNWGGFANASFSVTDGRRKLHVKLSARPVDQAKLRGWHELASLLSSRYRAPEVLGWIAIPATSHEGLVFRHLEGSLPHAWSGLLQAEVAEVLSRLHADRALRQRLLQHDSPRTCADGYFEDYHRRFEEDLADISARPPTFVSTALLAWMREEVAALARAVASSPAFAAPAAAPIHGDLWPGNVLLTPDARWSLLDWDELRLGDPVHDVAKLVYPVADDATFEAVAAMVEDEASRERLKLHARAVHLDWTIDPISDHVAVLDEDPEHAEAVRLRKEDEHRTALARYRERYG